MKAQTLRLQKKVTTQDVAVRFRHAHRCANRGLCSAKQIYPRGSVDLAVPYLCRKAQTSRCQQKVATQDVAARFKLIAQAWYTCDIALHAFLRNVPVCFPEYCRVLELAAASQFIGSEKQIGERDHWWLLVLPKYSFQNAVAIESRTSVQDVMTKKSAHEKILEIRCTKYIL